MKKSLMCAALLTAFSGAALAQSQVTLYGVIDGGVTVSKTKKSSATVQMTSGNWLGSRWGIQGSEDLGNGNAVFFKLEQGFNMASGAASKADKAFNRESALGLKGDWGTFAMGRFGGLSSDCGSYSILGGAPFTTSFQTVGNLYSAFYLSDRYDNSLVYVTPEFNGVQGHLMYSNGRSDDANKWSKNQHYYGAGLTYSAGALNVDVIYEALDYKGEANKAKTTQLINLGASYDFGGFTLHGAYEYALHAPLPGEAELTGFNGGKGNNYNAFSVGASADVLGGTLMMQTQFAFGKTKNELAAGEQDKFNTWSVGAAYLYNLSKRTLVYAHAGVGDTGKAMKAANDLRGWNATIGMTHKF